MNPHRIVGLVAALTVAEPSACDRVALTELVSMSQQLRGWLDAFDGECAVALGDPGVFVAEGRRSAREAKAIAARGETCASMPALHSALAAGAVSAGHVDAIARAAGQLDDDVRAELVDAAADLVEAASLSTVEWFERHVCDFARRLEADDGLRQRERVRTQRSLRRWIDHQTGLCHTHLALDPEADARFSAALDAAVAAEKAKPDVESRTFEQLRADAFVTLATGVRAAGRRPAEISVLIDHDTLTNGLHEHSVCETADGQPLAPASIRRLACDAVIIPITLDTDGAVLNHGRGRRVASEAQRRALRAMYRTCGHPGCDVRFGDCEIHHVIEWIRHRGPTDLDNLLPLCNTHHHLVHEGGWHLTLRPDRTITLRRPDGNVAFEGSTIDVAPVSSRRAAA